MGGADETTLKYISNSLGKETIRAISNSRSWSKQGSYSQNFNKTGRELMTEYELSVMPNNNCVLFIRGEHPFYCTKYPLEKHPNYKRSGDANDKYLYDVSEQVYTGINRRPIEEKDRYTQLYEECQQADLRDAEREHRLRMRPMEQASARGRRLCESQRLSETAKEYVREHIPVPAPDLSDEALAGMMNQTFKEEKPLPVTEGGEEILQDLYSSIVDYWEMDEEQDVDHTEPDMDMSDDAAEDPESMEYDMTDDFDDINDDQDYLPPDFDDSMQD